MATAQEKPNKKAIAKWFDKNWGAQARCAKALGIARPTLTMWLNGKRPSARLDRDVPVYVRAQQK